jgi:membrane associated rhomboid family serine protease
MKRRPPRPLPVVTVALAAAIIAVYGLKLAGGGTDIYQRFGFVPAAPTLATALTSLLVHDPATFAHVGGNVVVLVLIGVPVERAIGSTRFAGLFLGGGLAGAGLHVVVDPSSTAPLVGGSGALFAVLAVAAALFGPAMLAFVTVLVATNVAQAFGAPGAEGVSFGAHIGGFAMGVALVALVVLARLRGTDLRRAVAV